MRNCIKINDDVLMQIDEQWGDLSFCGLEILKASSTHIQVNVELLKSVKCDVLRNVFTKFVNESRVRNINKPISDCVHVANCEINEINTEFKEGTLYLNPNSEYEKRIFNLFSSGSSAISNVMFDSDSKILLFVQKLYSFCSCKNVIMASRYFHPNMFIGLIKRARGSLTICMTYTDQLNRNQIRTDLGKGFILKRGNTNEIHQREILFNKILISFNDDFNKIDVQNKTWTMTLMLCESTFNERYGILNNLRMA